MTSDSTIFENITFIGIGLIGSSLARAIKKHNLSGHITAFDKNAESLQKALELGVVDSIADNYEEAVKKADLVMLCVPVGACGEVASKIAPFLKDGCILSDVGSVKMAVINSVQPYISDKIHFIPAHPIAGTENSGPEAGFAELFEGRWCILTPLAEVNEQAIHRLEKMWQNIGSNTERMDPSHHDKVLGITSHLPHLIAYSIVGTASDLEDQLKQEVIKYSASGFRDFTRIAASDPVMWRDIFLNNREAVLEILQRFNEDLTALQRAIRWGDGDQLYNLFKKTRDIRRGVIEAKQDDPEDFKLIKK